VLRGAEVTAAGDPATIVAFRVVGVRYTVVWSRGVCAVGSEDDVIPYRLH
jgi:hypothetical protein